MDNNSTLGGGTGSDPVNGLQTPPTPISDVVVNQVVPPTVEPVVEQPVVEPIVEPVVEQPAVADTTETVTGGDVPVSTPAPTEPTVM